MDDEDAAVDKRIHLAQRLGEGGGVAGLLVCETVHVHGSGVLPGVEREVEGLAVFAVGAEGHGVEGDEPGRGRVDAAGVHHDGDVRVRLDVLGGVGGFVSRSRHGVRS